MDATNGLAIEESDVAKQRKIGALHSNINFPVTTDANDVG